MAVDSSLEYGKRLIPQILDRLASTEPDRIVFSVATFSRSPTFQHISARVFASAVDKTAWWLRQHVQVADEISNGEQNSGVNGERQASPKIRPLGYIGPRKWRESARKKQCQKLISY